MKLRLTPSTEHTAIKKKSEGSHLREHEIQRTLIEWVHWTEWRRHEFQMLFAIPNGVPLHGPEKFGIVQWLKQQGLKKGVPDLFLACAKGKWHGLFIEMKVAGAEPDADQELWLGRLMCEGYRVAVCHSFEEAKDTLLEYVDL